MPQRPAGTTVSHAETRNQAEFKNFSGGHVEEELRHESYPMLVYELHKDEIRLNSVDQIIAFLTERIEENRWSRAIAEFDHYAHTKSLDSGQIDREILAAKNLVFCFGLTLADPGALGLRPRSIGVCELTDRFVLSYMQAPMPVANTVIRGWLESLRQQKDG